MGREAESESEEATAGVREGGLTTKKFNAAGRTMSGRRSRVQLKFEPLETLSSVPTAGGTGGTGTSYSL